MNSPEAPRPVTDGLQVLWEDGDRNFCRGYRQGTDGGRHTVLAVLPATEHPTPTSLDRLAHEYGLKEELDAAWAVRPLELVRERGLTVLVLEDPGCELLGQLLGAPLELRCFLRFAVGIASALDQAHRCGLVHKDIRPANIFVSRTTGEVRLTGFGIASRLLRERPGPGPPETIAGTLAYMAPEQTGRMNRSIDARSDLYALGVTFYQMLTGALPFTASDPLEWVHCHIARKPMAPSERLENIPAPVSHIIMKLLAKTAEERYQTASGVGRDLRRCLAEYEAQHHIDNFVLGEGDFPDGLLIPEKLYGRERELDALLAAFDRIVENGTPELVLVSGYSGIGKSSVVSELQKVLVPPRGLYATGKFDQYKRDIPYSTVAQAFQSLIRPLLARSDAELSSWRDALREALGPNGQLMVDLVPELKLIIGDQPPVPELPPQDAQRRFQLVLRRFIGVFARPEHPLVLFLDDLQWLDAATLDLLENLLTQADVQHLLLIGAYRDNEVSAAHPLMRKLEAIRRTGAPMQEIRLAPLARDQGAQLVADALRCEPTRSAELAALLHEKTAGNPFFLIQFLQALPEEGLLRFEHDQARWCWDVERIHTKAFTENVADLMIGRIGKLPDRVQRALQTLACLGNSGEVATLSLVQGASEEQIHADLWDAVRLELIRRSDGSYKFAHDRIHEAAYSLVAVELRSEAHLRIGRLLATHTPPDEREGAIFEIVNQLNRGATLIATRDEREQLAEFNLIAGRRAKASTAYASALSYLAAGSALLAEDSWERRHELTFALEVNRVECEFLTGELADVERRLSALSTRAADAAEQARVACLRVDLYLLFGQHRSALAVGLDYLRTVGIDWSLRPTEGEVEAEYKRTCSRLGDRAIEELIDLPLMTDATCLSALDVLTRIFIPSVTTNANLSALVTCRAVSLSLEQGNCDASCAHYAWLGRFLASQIGDYAAALRFGQLACDLVERRGLTRFQARVYLAVGTNVLPWIRHVREGRELVRRTVDVAMMAGDFIIAAHGLLQLNSAMLTGGDPLGGVQRHIEASLDNARKMKFSGAIDFIRTQLAYVRTLRGLTQTFGSFNDFQFSESTIERSFAQNPDLASQECAYWIRKLQARTFAGDYAAAIDARKKAERRLWTIIEFARAEFYFYSALSHSAYCDNAAASEKQHHQKIVRAHHIRLRTWAENCSENFEDRTALVGAELARLEGRDLDAQRLYEQAIRAARANGFVHIEALAYEVAARFYGARGFEKFAHVYLQNARNSYVRWGADGKVRQLDELHPHLREQEPASARTSSTIGTSVEHLDLATVIKVSQAVSGEIVLENLLDTLMRTAIEQAGAERGLLILQRGSAVRIEAEATIGGDTVVVQPCDQPVTASVLPESVLHYVLRTCESVLLDDASAQPTFGTDPYIRERQARSILCLPLLNQAKLIGVLYLENNLAPRVFVPARLAVLKLLASQAAISLENAHLYRDLEQREGKIRRLVDANIIGIYLWKLDGQIIEANDTYLRMVGFDREDLVAGRLRWTDLPPPDWRDRSARGVEGLKMAGRMTPQEREFLRKDGSRVPVLLGSALFDEQRDEGVSFVLDLSEQKRAEAEARESEQRYREMQMELAHANRVATMGQLTASITHEIKQPLAATVANAEAALRWLRRRPPDLEEVQQALGRIAEIGRRAGDVVSQIRALIQKAPPRKDPVDLNAAILEVIEFTRGEAAKNGVSVRVQLADDVPPVYGDRVQLQQVVLNLVINAIEAMSSVSDIARDLLVSTGRTEPVGVLVAVADSGPGLGSASPERLFDSFYTTKAAGLGMGLSICRSIIDAHGGRLWASTRAPQGAIFQFVLPEGAESAS